jgi:hypothetical protein
MIIEQKNLTKKNPKKPETKQTNKRKTKIKKQTNKLTKIILVETYMKHVFWGNLVGILSSPFLLQLTFVPLQVDAL